jgi:hypothetical protein
MASTKKYHITITDNESGAVYVDRNSDAVIGSLDYGENKIQGVSYIDGANGATVMAILKSLDTIRDELFTDEPMLRFYYALLADKKSI